MAGLAGPRSLRHLLDAVLTVGSDLDLPAVLERIVRAATELVDARCGALGVLDDKGERLSQFWSRSVPATTSSASAARSTKRCAPSSSTGGAARCSTRHWQEAERPAGPPGWWPPAGLAESAATAAA